MLLIAFITRARRQKQHIAHQFESDGFRVVLGGGKWMHRHSFRSAPRHPIQQLDEIPLRLELRTQLRQVVAKLSGLILRVHQSAYLANQLNSLFISGVIGLLDDG